MVGMLNLLGGSIEGAKNVDGLYIAVIHYFSGLVSMLTSMVDMKGTLLNPESWCPLHRSVT